MSAPLLIIEFIKQVRGKGDKMRGFHTFYRLCAMNLINSIIYAQEHEF